MITVGLMIWDKVHEYINKKDYKNADELAGAYDILIKHMHDLIDMVPHKQEATTNDEDIEEARLPWEQEGTAND